MAVLEPRLAILDETDSGLDIDALKVVAHGVNAMRQPGSRVPAGDALPAPAQLRRARRGARARRRSHHPFRRQGTGARARGEGIRLARSGRSGADDGCSALESLRRRVGACRPAAASTREPQADRRSPARMPGADSCRSAFPRPATRNGDSPASRRLRKAAFSLGAALRRRLERRCRPIPARRRVAQRRIGVRQRPLCGRRCPAIGTLPSGSRVESLAYSLADPSATELEPHLARVAPFERHPFVALNTAFFDDGACIQAAARAPSCSSRFIVLFVAMPERRPDR